jgi:hypothetical protein
MEQLKFSAVTAWRQFEGSASGFAVARDTAALSGAVQVAGRVENRSAVGIVSVDISPFLVVKEPKERACIVARGMRILQDFAGCCRGNCCIFFVFRVSGLTHNP